MKQSLTTEQNITVKQARKLMGVASKTMSDEEIAELVNTFDMIAVLVINDYKDSKIK